MGVIKLTFYSGKIWHSEKPVPELVERYDAEMNAYDHGRYSREMKDWLSTAYEVVNPEVIPFIVKSFDKIIRKDGRTYHHFNDGEWFTLPDGYGIEDFEQFKKITIPQKPQLPDDYNHAKRAIRDKEGNVIGHEAFNPCVKKQKPLEERLDSISKKIAEKPDNSAHGYTEGSEREDLTKAPDKLETYAGTMYLGGDPLGIQKDIDQWIKNEKAGIPPISGREKRWRLKRAGVIEQNVEPSESQEEMWAEFEKEFVQKSIIRMGTKQIIAELSQKFTITRK